MMEFRFPVEAGKSAMRSGKVEQVFQMAMDVREGGYEYTGNAHRERQGRGAPDDGREATLWQEKDVW